SMQETKEAETLNGKNAAKASPPARAAGYEGRKIGWTRLLRHILPHKVRRLLVEHDALEEMRSEVQWLRDHMERSLLLQGRLAARAIAKVHPLHTRRCRIPGLLAMGRGRNHRVAGDASR